MKNRNFNRMHQAFLNKEQKSLESVYRSCFQELVLFCLGKCKNREMAKDIAAETLEVLLMQKNIAEIENLRAWLFGVANKIAMRLLTKDQRRSKILHSVSHLFPDIIHADADTQIDERIIDRHLHLKLKEKDYKIWELMRQGYNNKEIAETLTMNEKTVANRKSIIKRKLQEEFLS